MPVQSAKEKDPLEVHWVKADKIAALFDCSIDAVWRGLLGTDRIPRIDLNQGKPKTGRRPRRAMRYYWPAALVLSKGLLDQWYEEERERREAGGRFRKELRHLAK